MKRACVLLALLLSGSASASETLLLVVEDPTGRFEGTALRRAVANELGRQCIAPDDAAAASATDRLAIQITAEGTARVLYSGSGASKRSLRRVVQLPADTEDAATVLVLLAGNLARDQTPELELSAPALPPSNGVTPAEVPRRWALEAGLGGAVDRSHPGFALQLGAHRRWRYLSFGLDFQFTRVFGGFPTVDQDVPKVRTTLSLPAKFHAKFEHLSLEAGLGVGVAYWEDMGELSSFGTFTSTEFAFMVRFLAALVIPLDGVDLLIQPEFAPTTHAVPYGSLIVGFRFSI